MYIKIMSEITKRSNLLTFVSFILFVIVFSNGLFIYSISERLKNDAKAVNDAGIVRGSIQRVTKLALAGMDPSDKIREINSMLETLGREENRLEGFLRSGRFNGIQKDLLQKWAQLQQGLEGLDTDGGPENRRRIVDLSEQCWEAANGLVFETQFISEIKLSFLNYVFVIIGFNIAFVVISIFLIRKHVRNELEFLASHDPLTMLLNRYSYNIILRQDLNRTRRYHSNLSLLMIDIDHYKSVNDRFGHDSGDEVLKKIAQIIAGTVRSSDAVFRIGGEEFAVIVLNANMEQARQLSEKIREAVYSFDFDKVGKITVSIGFAECREED
ncbi:MAG: GGDEF domain-containing protein, partial [Nitrospiraceae bacterium]